MGGINHQPTNQVSNDLTVPASAALSHGMIKFLEANAHIEDAIVFESREFGAAKSKIQLAVASLEASIIQSYVAMHFVERLIQAIERPDYYPFEVLTSRPVHLAETLVGHGMLPNSAATESAANTLEAGDYHKSFHSYLEQLSKVVASVNGVKDVLNNYLDSEKSNQGYFWMEVENGRLPFRQAYAKALTNWLNFMASWQTTALISTEVHLKAINAPSLLED